MLTLVEYVSYTVVFFVYGKQIVIYNHLLAFIFKIYVVKLYLTNLLSIRDVLKDLFQVLKRLWMLLKRENPIGMLQSQVSTLNFCYLKFPNCKIKLFRLQCLHYF